MPEITKWCGCATLNPGNAQLWVVKDEVSDGYAAQEFSLVEVIEAGLRVKLVGLDDADRDAAIADCVADTLDGLKHLHTARSDAEALLRSVTERSERGI